MSFLGDMVVRITGDITQFNQSINDAQNKFQAASSNFVKLGSNLTKMVTIPIVGLGVAAVKSAADLEMMQSSFETMLGSAEDAKKMVEEFRKLAAVTPFSTSDIADAGKTLLQFGVNAKDILPIVKQLGDVSLGNSQRFGQLALVFGQISSTGRLMGQDLLQLINAGFNPLQVISQKTGISMGELKKRMEAGAISAEMVADAFKSATSEGGQFFGGMEKASKTFSGQLSTLLDDLKAVGQSIGEILIPTLKDIMKEVSRWIAGFAALDDGTKKTIVTIALTAATIGPLILVIAKLVEAVSILKVAMLALAGNPIILGLLAVSTAVILLGSELNKANTYAERLKASLAGTSSEKDMAKTLADINEQLDRRRRLLVAAERGDPERAKALKDEILALEQQKSAVIDNMRAVAMNAKGKEEAAKAEASIGTAIQTTTSAFTSLTQAATEYSINQKDVMTGYDALSERGGKYNQQAIAEYKQWKANQLAMEQWAVVAEQAASIGKSAFTDLFTGLGQMMTDSQFQWTDLAKIAANAIASIINALGQQLLVMAITALPNIGLSLAYGAGAAAAFVGAGIVKGLVAGFQEGTQFAPGGMAMVGENGPEMISMPKGSKVYNATQSDNILASGRSGVDSTPIHLQVVMDSRTFLDKIFEATRNKTVLIDAKAVVG